MKKVGTSLYAIIMDASIYSMFKIFTKGGACSIVYYVFSKTEHYSHFLMWKFEQSLRIQGCRLLQIPLND